MGVAGDACKMYPRNHSFASLVYRHYPTKETKRVGKNNLTNTQLVHHYLYEQDWFPRITTQEEDEQIFIKHVNHVSRDENRRTQELLYISCLRKTIDTNGISIDPSKHISK